MVKMKDNNCAHALERERECNQATVYLRDSSVEECDQRKETVVMRINISGAFFE
jgi:hypothetical protein